MPGPLRDVVQKFTIDSTGYDAGIARMIRDNEDLIASIAKVKREIAGIGAALGALPDGKKIRIDVDTGDAMGAIAALKGELGSLGDREITVAVRYVTTGDHPAGAGAVPGVGGDGAAMLRELRDTSASMDQVTSSLGRMEQHLASMRRDVADSSADLMMQTQMLRDNADAHNAAATAVAALGAARRGSGGGGGGGWGAAAARLPLLAEAAEAAEAGPPWPQRRRALLAAAGTRAPPGPCGRPSARSSGRGCPAPTTS